MAQFWGEAILLSFLALGLGIALAVPILPVFNGLVGKQLHIAFREDGVLAAVAFGLMVVVGLIAGSYPALALSRFQPVESLKGRLHVGGGSRVTRVLVVLQYSASVALIICTGIVLEQQAYVQSKDLGYDREHVVVVSVWGKGGEQVAERYKRAILSYSQIVNATVSDRNFTSGSMSMGYKRPGGSQIYLQNIRIDPDYVETLGLTMLEGRNFTDDNPSDRQNAVLVNETTIQELGLGDPVGKPLNGYAFSGMKNPTIIGVVRNFHVGSLHTPIPPLLMQMAHYLGGPEVLIRIRPNDLAGTLTFLRQTWEELAPDREYRQSFLDENLENQYRSERHWQSVLAYSACFAVTVSCLGLFGLASLAVARRTREIGLRKALGATVTGLLRLLSRDFAWLLILANLAAWPIAYWAMRRWLEGFAYRIDLGAGPFLAAGGLVLVVALLTVSLHTISAALKNPVDSLRHE